MNQQSDVTTGKRNIWLRAVLMALMGAAYHLCGTLLFFVAVIQFIIALLHHPPNPRLVRFGRSLGNYLRQIANFLAFASEDIPFPFSDWPSAE